MPELNVPRREINNLLVDGNFERVPNPNTDPTSTTARWIDGTAAGSTDTNNILLRWCLLVNGSGFEAQFDETVKHRGRASMKLSSTTESSRGQIRGIRQSTTEVRSRCVPVLPNTSYKVSAWIKTVNVPSASKLQVVRYNGDAAAIGGDWNLFSLSGDNDWAKYEFEMTTGDSDRFWDIRPGNNTAGQVGDIWFDDIRVVPSSGIERLPV